MFGQGRRLISNLFSKIYVVLYIYFVIDCIFMSDGHYVNLFSVFGTSITPRLIIYLVLLIFFLIRLIVNKSTAISPISFIFILLFLYCSFSFFVGANLNGLSNSWIDFRSVMLLLIFLPTYDIFFNGLLKIKNLYFLVLVLAFFASSFIIAIYIFQLSKGYTYSYMTWLFGRTQNKFSSFLNLSFRQGAGVFHDSLFYITILISINICLLFFLDSLKRIWRSLLIVSTSIMFFAVIQSVTKGFIIFIIGVFLYCLILYVYNYSKKRVSNGLTPFSTTSILLLIFLGAILIFIAVIVSNFINIARLFDFTSSSTTIRITFIKESFEQIFKPSIIFGKFFGYHIPSKGEVHLEISLLEVLLKQGFLGLVLWILPFSTIFKAIKKNAFLNYPFKNAFYICLFAVYVISFFNPHLCSISGILILSLTLAGVCSFCKSKNENANFVFACFNEDQVVFYNSDNSLIFATENKISLRSFIYYLSVLKSDYIVFYDYTSNITPSNIQLTSHLYFNPTVCVRKKKHLFLRQFLVKTGTVVPSINKDVLYFGVDKGSLCLCDKDILNKRVSNVCDIFHFALMCGICPTNMSYQKNDANRCSKKQTFFSCYLFNLLYNSYIFISDCISFGIKKTVFILKFKKIQIKKMRL